MMKKISLVVLGMHCRSCEMLIKEALTDLGATDVVVSQKEESVKVTFDDTKLKESEIITAIENEGYTVA
jgi:copper chaperone CopZ